MTEALLARYLANSSTPDETRQVLDWLSTPNGQRFLAQRLDADLTADWQATHDDPAANAHTAQLLTALHERLNAEPTVADPNRTGASPFPAKSPPRAVPIIPLTSQPRRWYQTWAARAATVLLVVGIGVGGYYQYRQANPVEEVVATTYGQTQVVRLPDQSRVTLNGNSRLRYAPNWTDGQPREVWLEGEGFFDVTHTARHTPFRVHLPDKLQIEVLGTSFNVSARVMQTQVVLNSGHIRLSNASKPGAVDMQPGDLFEADRTTQTVNIVRKRVDPTVYASWRGDRLSFDRTSLAEIVRRLEDTYGLHVTVTDKRLLTQQFSGTIPNQNIDVLLDGLSGLFGIAVQRQGNQLILEPIN